METKREFCAPAQTLRRYAAPMVALRLLHLGMLFAWAGVVLVEGVIELSDLDDGAVATRLHYRIDLLIEGPLLLAVLVSGALLWAAAPASPLLYVKIACGLVAVLANLLCLGFVVARYRRRDDRDARLRWGRYVRGSILALPFALAAASLGLSHFHR